MKSTIRPALALAVAITAVLSLAATEAFAHRGGGKRLAAGNATALVTEAAKQLGVTQAKLTDAITDAAVARIDEAVEDEDVDADDADELKERAQESLRYALAVSRTKAVASNLGITTAKLNSGFRAARKAVAIARIDQALEDGDIDEEEAAELKEEAGARTYAGYKAGGLGSLGGPGGRGPRGR